MNALHHLFTSAGIAVTDKEVPEKQHTEKESSAAVEPLLKLSDEFAAHYPLKILIAEDDMMNQQLALMILKRLGYSADVAPDGKEVLEVVSEKKYDLILMDVQMPLMDGLEATRMLRLCLNAQPVIIAMTANAMEGDREACLAAGMDDYISKPVNLDQLMQKLSTWSRHVREKQST
jgi:CheY-like chemotaxis protein